MKGRTKDKPKPDAAADAAVLGGAVVLTKFGNPFKAAGGRFTIYPTLEEASGIARRYSQAAAFRSFAPFEAVRCAVSLRRR